MHRSKSRPMIRIVIVGRDENVVIMCCSTRNTVFRTISAPLSPLLKCFLIVSYLSTPIIPSCTHLVGIRVHDKMGHLLRVIGVLLLKAEKSSCPYPQFADAQILNSKVAKHTRWSYIRVLWDSAGRLWGRVMAAARHQKAVTWSCAIIKRYCRAES